MFQHQQFDRFARQWLADYHTTGRTIYCQAGCSGCCSLVVHTTFPEAMRIAQQLTTDQERQLALYLERLRRAVPHLSSMKSYLRSHRSQLGACPLLDSAGRCTVYPERPLSCRALLSTRPSAWCVADLSRLDPWDKRAYQAGLDRQVVTWPTHFVAATRDLAEELERQILETMRAETGWSLWGNLAVLIGLARAFLLEAGATMTAGDILERINHLGLNVPWLLNLQAEPCHDVMESR
jgi:Fe-S-cluster containining protein